MPRACAQTVRAAGLAFAVLVGAVGCAHKPAADETGAAELQRQVATLRAQNASYLKQIEELENRVFILTDQVESRRTNAERVSGPALPRVTLRPGEPAPGSEPGVITSDDDGVEYAGEAARTSTQRPVLRLVGSGRDASVQNGPQPDAAETRPAREAVPLHVVSEAAPRRSARAAQELYKRSLDALTSGAHADAAAGFREFLRLHPSHDYADNAQYWLAECYYDLKDFATAAREFRKVVDRYPDGNKVPDAMLKLGFATMSLGDDRAGRAILAQVVRTYPRHEAAGRAQAKLAEGDDVVAGAHGAKEVP